MDWGCLLLLSPYSLPGTPLPPSRVCRTTHLLPGMPGMPDSSSGLGMPDSPGLVCPTTPRLGMPDYPRLGMPDCLRAGYGTPAVYGTLAVLVVRHPGSRFRDILLIPAQLLEAILLSLILF